MEDSPATALPVLPQTRFLSKGRDSKGRFLQGANWVCAFPGPNLSQKLQNHRWRSRSLLYHHDITV